MEMERRLYVYTGTGNSLWTARLLAQELGEASVEFMPCPSEDFPVSADRVDLIFPVHIWGLPIRVIRFIGHLLIKMPISTRPFPFAYSTDISGLDPALFSYSWIGI